MCRQSIYIRHLITLIFFDLFLTYLYNNLIHKKSSKYASTYGTQKVFLTILRELI